MSDTTGRQRFLDTLALKPTDQRPIWLMRQAGRCLPEYNELKAQHGFLKMVRTPELATEVTLQPIRRFDFDVAVIFSDILIIPEAMGQSYSFGDGKGIQMEYPMDTAERIDALEPEAIPEKLSYMFEAEKLTRQELGDKTALLGFNGAPWTLANFMAEGKSTKEYTKAKILFHSNRNLFDKLMNKLCRAITLCLTQQAEAGVDVLQIFDTFGGSMAPDLYWDASGKWIKKIIDDLETDLPVIVYRRGPYPAFELIGKLGCNGLGLDHTVTFPEIRKTLPNMALQGNLDSALLLSDPATVKEATTKLLASLNDDPGYIINLGHGVLPGTKLDCIEALVETVRS